MRSSLGSKALVAAPIAALSAWLFLARPVSVIGFVMASIVAVCASAAIWRALRRRNVKALGAALVVALLYSAAPSMSDARTIEGDDGAPITVGAWTFDEFGRYSRLTMPDGRTVDFAYAADTVKLVAVRLNNGAWQAPPLIALQMRQPEPRMLLDEEDAYMGAMMAAMAASASSFWSDIFGPMSWYGPQCQNRCDIMGGWALAGCAGIAMIDDAAGFACVLMETGAITACKVMCAP